MVYHDTDNINSYLSSVIHELFGDRLAGIIATDSYLRQPDYSSRVAGHYYFVLSGRAQCGDALALRYAGREFPTFIFNFIYEDELIRYPAHAVWQFQCSQWLFVKNDCKTAMSEREPVEEYRQAIFAISHLSRLYYLRKLDLKTHLWGVRQLGWAIRYARRCLFNEPAMLDCSLDMQGIADRHWLMDLHEHWALHERQLTNSESMFRDLASRLSDIASRRADLLQERHPMDVLAASTGHDLVSEGIATMVAAVKLRLVQELGPSLFSFYLHGSAARGDMRSGSDIDSFIIVDQVDRNILEIVRQIQSDYPLFTILVYGLAEINHYPRFRRYTLASGTKLVGGDWRLNFKIDARDEIVAVINNIFTIRQVVRSYLVEGSYGARAIYMATLMTKLLDHGCLRPMQKLMSKEYPISRAAVRAFFSDRVICTRVLDFIDKLELNEKALKRALLKGNATPLEALFYDLLDVTALIEARTRDYVQ